MRSNRNHAILLACAVMAASMAATSVSADDLRRKFDLISVGMTGAAVRAIMPPPTASSETTTLGISYGQLRWSASSRGPAFSISFVGDRVVGKTTCDRPADC